MPGVPNNNCRGNRISEDCTAGYKHTHSERPVTGLLVRKKMASLMPTLSAALANAADERRRLKMAENSKIEWCHHTFNAALRGGEAVPLESTVMQRED